MRRIRRGWAPAKKSWELSGEHRSLIRFPLQASAAPGAPT